MPSQRALISSLRFATVLLAANCAMGTPVWSQVTEPGLVRARYLGLDSTLVREKATRLTVVVRPLEEPERVLEGVHIAILSSPDTVLVPHQMPFVRTGITTVRISPASTRFVAVRRLGYGAALVRVRLVAGCHSRLEVYLPMVLSCVDGCPVDAARATMTECGDGA